MDLMEFFLLDIHRKLVWSDLHRLEDLYRRARQVSAHAVARDHIPDPGVRNFLQPLEDAPTRGALREEGRP
jgi:hypothetical protein